MQPIEFIDYIFDRYAYLGLPADASAPAIREAIRIRRAQNHSDKLSFVSDEIRQVAERARGLVDDCARVLLDSDLRAAFDARLQEFQATAPHLISDSGVCLLDPSRFRVDIDDLLHDDAQDPAELIQRVAAMTGYDSKRLARARSRFAKDPEDWTLREDLRSELTTAFAFHSVLEDVYWQRAGVSGGTVKGEHDRAQDTTAFTERLQARLEEVRSHAVATIEHRSGLAALGFAPPLLLTYADGTQSGPTADTHAVVQKVLASFEDRKRDLEAAVAQKKALADELVSVRRAAQVRPDSGTGILDIVYIRATDPEAELESWPPADYELLGVAFRLDANTEAMAVCPEPPSADAIATWPHALVLLEVNRELPGVLMEVVAEANGWLARHKAARPGQ